MTCLGLDQGHAIPSDFDTLVFSWGYREHSAELGDGVNIVNMRVEDKLCWSSCPFLLSFLERMGGMEKDDGCFTPHNRTSHIASRLLHPVPCAQLYPFHGQNWKNP